MEKKAGEDEILEEERGSPAVIASAPKRRKTEPVNGASGADVCDDVAGNILARLPARSAIACTALSKRHCRLIRSPQFRSLHLRLAPPLPRPQIAYVSTAPIRRRPEHEPVSGYHGFHVAGLRRNDPMRVLAGGRYLGTRYANTCNGIVLISGEKFSVITRGADEIEPVREQDYWEHRVTSIGKRRKSPFLMYFSDMKIVVFVSVPHECFKALLANRESYTGHWDPNVIGTNLLHESVKETFRRRRHHSSSAPSVTFSASGRYALWNPAVPDDAKEVAIPDYWWPKSGSTYLVLALGYGRRSKTYKLLVCRKYDPRGSHYPGGGKCCGYGKCCYKYSLMIYALGGGEENSKRPPQLVVLSAGLKEKINLKSLKTLYMDGTIYLLRFDEPAVLAFDVDEETVS
ncbi:unnamed protein product [Urochloa humidicola]